VKLILANNQSEKFIAFYKELQAKSPTPFDYSAYRDLLFIFDTDSAKPITVQDLGTGKQLDEYDGIYINGYLHTYELAATVAICADALGIPYVNREMSSPPSLSKLTTYAKLAAAGIGVPRTLAGTKKALMLANLADATFPAVLKRADADRGVDNFKVTSPGEVQEILEDQEERSLWILQNFIPHDGFYLVSFYDSKPVFSIFRTLEKRPDGDERKAHMYKPKGGANANLIDLDKLPLTILETCQNAMTAMNRQIGSVDCIYDTGNDRVYILEVNYNPQIVTIETFKDTRIEAFLANLENIK
jgi:glutathione synthase/RimK-type ligase-like ATP-grasp enzyme